jgi:hypothetical protein
MRREESRKAYTKGTQPRSTYTDRTGVTRPTNDRQVEEVRRQVSWDDWVWRQRRQREFAERNRIPMPAPTGPPVVVYHDPYSNVFWLWLLAQSLDQQARWAYHHHDTMDDARYRDLLARNDQLPAKISQVERDDGPRDPTYVPPGVPTDLMFSESYVDAAYNPQPIPPSPSQVWGALGKVLLVVAGIVFLFWLVFIKRWGGTDEEEDDERPLPHARRSD